MERNDKAYIRIRGNGFDFRCYLGNGRPKVSAGGAEYEALRRPQSAAATVFQGNALLALDVPVLFDGWGPSGQRRDIGPRVEQVYGLCFGAGRRPPPNFIATGPFPFSGSRFQMSLPEELDEPRPIVGEGGTLFRQALMLKLVEYNDPTAIRWKGASETGKSRNGGTTAPPSSIVLRQSESLLQVAAAVFGDPGEAAAIGRVNGIQDLRKKLKVGTRLKLPEQGVDEAEEV
jgi:hypothetical protein